LIKLWCRGQRGWTAAWRRSTCALLRHKTGWPALRGTLLLRHPWLSATLCLRRVRAAVHLGYQAYVLL